MMVFDTSKMERTVTSIDCGGVVSSNSNVLTVSGHWESPGTIADYVINSSTPLTRSLNAYLFVLNNSGVPLQFGVSEQLQKLSNRRLLIVGDSLASELHTTLSYMLDGLETFNITVTLIAMAVTVDGKLGQYGSTWDPANTDPLSRSLKTLGSLPGDVIILQFGNWYTNWHFDSTGFNLPHTWGLLLLTAHKALLVHAPAAQVLWLSTNHHHGTNFSSIDYHLRRCTTECDDVLAYADTAQERLDHPQEGDFQVFINRLTKDYFLEKISPHLPWSFLDLDAITMYRPDGHKGMGHDDGRGTVADCLHHVIPGVLEYSVSAIVQFIA